MNLTMASKRTAKVLQLHRSLAVILPKDWTVGMEIDAGDIVDLVYDREVRIRKRSETAKLAK